MGQRKYPIELRDRATRLAREALADSERARGAIKRVADELGVHPEAVRTWVRTAQVDAGQRPGTTTADAQRIKDLEREVRELRRANEILRKASAYFAQAEPSAAGSRPRFLHRGQQGARGLCRSAGS